MSDLENGTRATGADAQPPNYGSSYPSQPTNAYGGAGGYGAYSQNGVGIVGTAGELGISGGDYAGKDDLSAKRKVSRWWRITALILIFVSLAFFIATIVLAVELEKDDDSVLGGPGSVLLSESGSSRDGYGTVAELFPSSGFWTESIPDVPAPIDKISDFAAVAAGDRIFIVGGLLNDSTAKDVPSTISNYTYEFNTVTGAWAQRASMPRAVYRNAMGYDAGTNKIYVAGGLTGTTAGDADAFTGTLAYDVGSNTWTDMGISPAGAHADACGGVTTTSDGKARFYVAGGFKLPDYETSSDVDYLDISTNTWNSAASMPTARGDVACAVLNPSRSLVVVGGHDGNAHVGKVEILDVDDNSWSGAADMTVPRGDPAAVALSGDRVLVVGGEITVDHDRDESTDMRTEVAVHVGELYDRESDTWVKRAPIPTARFRFAAVAVGTTVYAFGGHDTCELTGSYTETLCHESVVTNSEAYFAIERPHLWAHIDEGKAKAEIYETAEAYLSTSAESAPGYVSMGLYHQGTGFWINKAPMEDDSGAAYKRSDFGALPVGHQIYLIGGFNEAMAATNTVIVYNTITGTYASGPAMPEPRARFAHAVDDSGKIYIIGGQAVDDFSDPVTSMLVLDTASGAWSGPHAIPSMPDTTADPTDRFDACAVFADGKIYLVGGYRSDYSGFLDSTLVFDASSGNMSAWTTGPRLKTARGDMACAAVDGAALVVGGWGAPDFRNSAAAERLEDGEWVVKASIPVPRGDATLISLEEGRALLVGGEHHHTGSPGTNLVAEHHVLEYVLAADEWVAKAPIEDGRFRHAAAAVDGVVHIFGGHPSCPDYNCAPLALSSVEAFEDVIHPSLHLHIAPTWLHRSEDAHDDHEGHEHYFTEEIEITVGDHGGAIEGYTLLGGLYDGEGYWYAADTEGDAAATVARSAAGAVAYSDHEVLLFGGVVAGTASDSVLMYDVQWRRATAMDPMPAALEGFLYARYGTTVYLFGGRDASGAVNARLWTFDVSDTAAGWVDRTATVSADGDAKLAVADGCAAVAGERIFLVHQSGSGTALSVLDPVSLSLHGMPADTEVPRSLMGCAGVGDRVFVVGGKGAASEDANPDGLHTELVSYNWRTDSWTTHSPLPVPKARLSLLAIEGRGDRLLAIGGEESHDNAEPVPSNTVHEYHIWTDSWSVRAPMPSRRYDARAVYVDETIYVFGGQSDADEHEAVVEAYVDPWLPPLYVFRKNDD